MKKTISLLLALVLMLSLCACGSAKSAARAPMPEPAAMQGSYYAADAAPAMAYEESAANGFGMSDAYAQAKEADTGGETPAENPEKIIYSSDVTVETTDFDASLAKIDELLAACGGWVESSSVNGSNYYNKSRGYNSTRSANYTLRIPSDRFGELMNSLSSLGNIPYTHTYTENVTAQYYDTEAHLLAYQTQETRLLEMMEKAETVEDIVILEDRLTELRWRIESLQSTLKNWDRRVSYSSVSLELREVQAYTPEAVTKISYGQRLWRSLKDGLKSVAEFFEELLIWFVGALPTLVILAVLFLILFKPVKRALSRRKEKRAAKRSPAAAEQKSTET
jgi:polyhydroxyalkanoate synthesis regulator phasin